MFARITICRCFVLALTVVYPMRTLRADFWHNPVLETGDARQWTQQLQPMVPQLAQMQKQMQNQNQRANLRVARTPEDLKNMGDAAASQPPVGNGRVATRGGDLQTNLAPQQMAFLGRKVDECLQTLAYMAPGNINPREFPQFPMHQIPRYRQAAQQMLLTMGPACGPAIVSRLRSELMGNTLSVPQSGMQVVPSYGRDILAIFQALARGGMLSQEDLDSVRQAASGQKGMAQQQLARQVLIVLSEFESLTKVLELLSQTDDPVHQATLLNQILARVPRADQADLLLILREPQIPAKARTAAGGELAKRTSKLSVSELLSLLEMNVDDRVNDAVIRDLRERRPTTDDIKGPIADIWQFAQSDNKQVSAYARWYVGLAFRDARMLYCLHWLGQGDEAMNKRIWEQVDARIARASEDDIAGFARDGIRAVQFEEATMASRLAALELLSRLKQKAIAGDLIDLLRTAPRELWPKIGSCLRDVTGQDYGPRPEDGFAELAGAIKNWQTWWERNRE